MRLQPAAARSREPDGSLARPAGRPFSGVLVRPRAVPLRRSTGKSVAKAASRFACIPNGIPGLETRLPLLFSAGVNEGRIDICRVCRVDLSQPRQDVRALPSQGSIAIGADADLAIWDANREVTITNEMLHHNVDYTPYEGMRVRGWPVTTVSRGEILWSDGQFHAPESHGQFLRCDPPNQSQPDRARRRDP